MENNPIPPTKIVFSHVDRKQILSRIDECLINGNVSDGENVRRFEMNFAKFVEVKHAVATSSGGAALELGMNLMQLKGREVIVPTNTFAATALAVRRAGGVVRLADIDPGTFSLSLEDVEKAITNETAGIIIVHVGGIVSPDILAIRELCNQRGIWLFEDAAHAHSSRLDGRPAGTFGLAGAFSFFATKVMTSGEGGMLVTNDDELAIRARVLRNYGKPDAWITLNQEEGFNWRMSEFSAVVGDVQLSRLIEFVSSRAAIAKKYDELLADKDLISLIPTGQRNEMSWYKYIVLVPSEHIRDHLKYRFRQNQIGVPGGVYDIPLHRQPVFANVGGSYPKADDVCGRHICLPIYVGMSAHDVDRVVDVLLKTLKEF